MAREQLDRDVPSERTANKPRPLKSQFFYELMRRVCKSWQGVGLMRVRRVLRFTMPRQIEGDHPVLLIELARHLAFEYFPTGRIAVDEENRHVTLSVFFVR